LELIKVTLKSVPDDPDLLLTRALALSAANRQQEAAARVKELEQRWPEWDRPYLLDALLLNGKARMSEAKQKIHIALVLGADELVTECILHPVKPGAAGSACPCNDPDFGMFFQCEERDAPG
jgi:hypothetical protein